MSRPLKFLLCISLVVNALLVGGAFWAAHQRGGIRSAWTRLVKPDPSSMMRAHWEDRTNVFAAARPRTGRCIVFLGDSLVEGCNWHELFDSDRCVLNRGISGDTIEGVLSRLHQVTALSPKKIFILVGINDVSAGHETSRILNQFTQLLGRLKTEVPETELYVISLLPVNDTLNPALRGVNHGAAQCNDLLRGSSLGEGITFVDVHDLLLNEDGQLSREFTTDGLHLNHKGYQKLKPPLLSYFGEP